MRSHSWLSFALAMTLVGCSRGGSSDTLSLPTIPIATEAAVTIAPSTVPPTIAAVAPTEVEVVPSTAVVAPPTAVYDYSKIPVLVRFTPKDAGEQEIIDAMKLLLPLEQEIINSSAVTRARIRLFLTEELVDDELAAAEEQTARGEFGVPGDHDRYILRRIVRLNSGQFVVDACYVNNASSYAGLGISPTTIFLNNFLVSRVRKYSLVNRAQGWRVSAIKEVSKVTGSDKCEQ